MEQTAQQHLESRDYVLIMDKSGSMEETDCAGGMSRWNAMRESTEQLARKIEQFDTDGFTAIPFAGSFKAYENCKANTVTNIFNENHPGGGTVLAPVLEHAFADYLKRKAAGQTKQNGEMLIVVTDGAPQDESAVAKTIINFANKLTNADSEYGIQFLQIGKDQAASRFLKKLDDDLVAQGAKWDIVDTKTFEEIESIGITQALIAALDD